jgi:hypothetical protein
VTPSPNAKHVRTRARKWLSLDANVLTAKFSPTKKEALMDKETFDFVADRAAVLAKSGASKQETQAAAQAWLDATAGADAAAADAATNTLVDFLDGRPNAIDHVIEFAKGPAAQLFGEEAAAKMLAEQTARKEQGEKWCNCEACTAAVEILTKFGRI